MHLENIWFIANRHFKNIYSYRNKGRRNCRIENLLNSVKEIEKFLTNLIRVDSGVRTSTVRLVRLVPAVLISIAHSTHWNAIRAIIASKLTGRAVRRLVFLQRITTILNTFTVPILSGTIY